MSLENAKQRNATRRSRRATKKQQIIALYLAGITNIEDLARITDARAS